MLLAEPPLAVPLQNAHVYRLDIEMSRLEFLVHPGMAREDILVRGWASTLRRAA